MTERSCLQISLCCKIVFKDEMLIQRQNKNIFYKFFASALFYYFQLDASITICNYVCSVTGKKGKTFLV